MSYLIVLTLSPPGVQVGVRWLPPRQIDALLEDYTHCGVSVSSSSFTWPADRQRAPRPITGGGPHDYGGAIALGPARAAPLGLILGQQVIGVGLDEQFHEHRVHDAPPRGRRR
jgi:hypothetical protein